MAHQYPNTGILFVEKKKTNPKGPDHTGKIDIGADLLKQMLDAHNAGKDVVLRIAGWDKAGRNGTFISTRVEIERSETQAAGGGGGRQPSLNAGPRKASGPVESFDLDDEIPFISSGDLW